MRPALAAILLLVFLSHGGELRAADTDLEVILAADVSRSIDDAEFELQRKGYAAALIEVRPMNERGAAMIAAATLPASSSSRISVQSTTTC